MAAPATRAQFKEYCLRELGKPVIEINVDDDQVEDRIDYSLQTYWDYHFDGSEKTFFKYQIGANNRPQVISDIQIIAGGNNYQNGESLVFSGQTGNGAVITVLTNDSGTITNFTYTARGDGYMNAPDVTVNTASGSGANLVAYNGGYIPIPDNIIGAVNIFDIGDSMMTNNLFNIRYQIVLNDLYSLTSVSMVPYYMAMQHIQFLEYLLVGRQPIRYNRHQNKLYLDMNWDRWRDGGLVIAECYQVVDPNIFTDAWNDRWLKNYATAQIKKQWGTNLKKFEGMKMPGGLIFNGQKIYDEAVDEIRLLENDMIRSYSLPVTDMIGVKPFMINKSYIQRQFLKGKIKWNDMDLFTSGEMQEGMVDVT